MITLLLAYMLIGVVYLAASMLHDPPPRNNSAIKSLVAVIIYSLVWLPVTLYLKLWAD